MIRGKPLPRMIWQGHDITRRTLPIRLEKKKEDECTLNYFEVPFELWERIYKNIYGVASPPIVKPIFPKVDFVQKALGIDYCHVAGVRVVYTAFSVWYSSSNKDCDGRELNVTIKWRYPIWADKTDEPRQIPQK